MAVPRIWNNGDERNEKTPASGGDFIKSSAMKYTENM